MLILTGGRNGGGKRGLEWWRWRPWCFGGGGSLTCASIPSACVCVCVGGGGVSGVGAGEGRDEWPRDLTRIYRNNRKQS